MAHTIGFFTKSKGLQTDDSIKAAVEKYGTNRFDIPIPSFQELFKEHLVAPFFVFQLFCVALWFLDDMWYYSLFTLVMLFVFESTVVFQVSSGFIRATIFLIIIIHPQFLHFF